MEDDILKDPEDDIDDALIDDELELDADGNKKIKKEMLDEETESLDDLEEEEDMEEEEPFDDITNQ